MSDPTVFVTSSRVTLGEHGINITNDPRHSADTEPWTFTVPIPITTTGFSRYGNGEALGVLTGRARFADLDGATEAAKRVLIAIDGYATRSAEQERVLAQQLTEILPDNSRHDGYNSVPHLRTPL